MGKKRDALNNDIVMYQAIERNLRKVIADDLTVIEGLQAQVISLKAEIRVQWDLVERQKVTVRDLTAQLYPGAEFPDHCPDCGALCYTDKDGNFIRHAGDTFMPPCDMTDRPEILPEPRIEDRVTYSENKHIIEPPGMEGTD